MHTEWLGQDLAWLSLTVASFLFAQIFWRVRTTAIGRAYAAFTSLALLSAACSILAITAETNAPRLAAIAGSLAATAGFAVFHLTNIASHPARCFGMVRPIAFSLAAAALGAWAPGFVTSLWVLAAHAAAAHRLSGVPRRSWPRFEAALRSAQRATLAAGLFVFVAGLIPFDSVATAGPPLAELGLALALYFTLPQLGLLAPDRVQHSSVIEAMSDGVLVVDLDDRLVEVNESAREILAIEALALDLRPVSNVLSHHPDLIELFRGAIEGATLYALRSPDGSGTLRTYDLRLSALCDAQGAIQSRVLVLRDISDRIDVEEENRLQSRHVRLVHEISTTVHGADSIAHGIEASLHLIAQTMEFPVGHYLRSVDSEEASELVASGFFYCALPGGVDAGADRSHATGGRGEEEERQEFAKGVVRFDPRGVLWWKELGVEMVCTIPVVVGGRLYGVFEFFDLPGRVVPSTTSDLLEHVGGIVGQSIEKRMAEERVRRFAYRDDLTGLPNRQHFHQLLRAAVALAGRAERRMALLFLDLDGFKKVNDTLGHEVGDKLLAEVASRFSQIVRASDHLGVQSEAGEGPGSSVSRLGGDEFTVLLTEIQQPADAALVAGRLLATLETPIELSGQEIFMGTSIGIAVFPDDGTDAEALVRNADAAMYFAKGRGRNSYAFYSAEMNRSQSQRLEIESRLRLAVERNQLSIHYQPILSAETGKVVAAEALVRWREPEWGNVPPDKFIPIAEETGLIVGLGQWVFNSVCVQAKRWREERGATIRIGVNVSGKQIREPGMVAMVRRALEETDVSPTQIELELTESTIMQDDDVTTRTLRDLKDMGVGLALDDFGTGYSSLSYLRRFTIDRVKIDRSFIAELPDNASDGALTSAIIAMAHGLKLDVVAEGVETEAQARFLELRGCDELQGYLYGRPCPAEEFADWLQAGPRAISSGALPEKGEDGAPDADEERDGSA